MKKLIILIITLCAIHINAQTQAEYVRVATDTVAASADTLSRKVVSSTSNSLTDVLDRWYGFKIVATDTMEASKDGFTTRIIILPNNYVEFYPSFVNTSGNDNWLFRRYNVSGETGTPLYSLIFFGF